MRTIMISKRMVSLQVFVTGILCQNVHKNATPPPENHQKVDFLGLGFYYIPLSLHTCWKKTRHLLQQANSPKNIG